MNATTSAAATATTMRAEVANANGSAYNNVIASGVGGGLENVKAASSGHYGSTSTTDSGYQGKIVKVQFVVEERWWVV